MTVPRVVLSHVGVGSTSGDPHRACEGVAHLELGNRQELNVCQRKIEAGGTGLEQSLGALRARRELAQGGIQ